MEISKFRFRINMVQGGNFLGTYEMGLVFIDITMASDLSFYWGFPN